MSQAKYENVGTETIKGGLIKALAEENFGSLNFALLDLTGVVVDTEDFTVGGNVYEINVVATDNTLDTGTGGEYNNTSPVVNFPVAGKAVGDIIRIESEFALAIQVDANSAYFLRGFGGSTIAAHGNSVTIFEAVQQVAATSLAVPVSTTAESTADAQIAAAINYHSVGYNASLGGGRGVTTKSSMDLQASVLTDQVLLHYVANGTPVTNSETMANATLSAFEAGQEPASVKGSKIVHVVDAGDVTATFVRKVFPFIAAVVNVRVTTAVGVIKVWDGAAVVTTIGTNSFVDVDITGAVDWAATDILTIEATE